MIALQSCHQTHWFGSAANPPFTARLLAVCLPLSLLPLILKQKKKPEQKAKLIEGATQLLVDVLGKNPRTTVVVIDEVETDNWGIGGESVTVRRKRGE